MKSKMVIVIYPRKKGKLTKEQLVRQGAINSIMSLMSISGSLESGRLVFRLSDNPEQPGIPIGWFVGDSHFKTEVIRIMKKEDINTIFYWCQAEKIPAARGEINSEESVMVIGPYWTRRIDAIISRVISSKGVVRSLTTEKKKPAYNER